MKLEEFYELIEELKCTFETMREDGDSDMRTVIWHTENLIKCVKEDLGEE